MAACQYAVTISVSHTVVHRTYCEYYHFMPTLLSVAVLNPYGWPGDAVAMAEAVERNAEE